MISKEATTTTEQAELPDEYFVSANDTTRLYVRSRRAQVDFQHAPGTQPGCVAILSDGILCDGFIWKYLWDSLAHRVDVVHWHYRGHGRSGNPVDPNAISIAAHADDLNQVRSNMGDPPVVLFGHSMGCQVALEAYHQHPETVRGLVMLCGSFGKVTETFKGTKVLQQVLPTLLETVSKAPALARALWSRIPPSIALKIALFTKEIDPQSIRKEDMLPYFRNMTHVDFPMFLRMLEAAGVHTSEDYLEQITCPVLIVSGDRDTFTPPYLSEEMARKIPNSELLMIPGGTHVAPLEQTELINAKIDEFLQKCSLEPS
jgi:pimeloyl-ACP methyl ester carboxylesterase